MTRTAYTKLVLAKAALLLLVYSADAQQYPVVKVVDNGSDATHINFVYLSDGYTAANLNALWATDVANINAALFASPPYSNYASFFNVHRIDVPSADSGADHPGTATDVVEPASPTQLVNTAFDMTFDFNGIHRLLWSPSQIGRAHV